MGKPGADFIMEHDVVFGPIVGDWFDAARVYRECNEVDPFVRSLHFEWGQALRAAERILADKTNGGKQSTRYADIDYFKIFPADTRMLHSGHD